MTNAIISFIVAVAAGVVCHLICKWLDSNKNDNKPTKKTPE